jgi:hypothetical protein
MEEKEKHMLEDMFFKLLHEEGHIFDRLAIYEEFSYRAIDCLEHGKDVTAFIDLLEHFETIALEHNKELLCGFFFALADMLTLKFKYSKMPNERIDRKDHEAEFKQLREKFGWNDVHVIDKNTTQVENSLSHVK